MTETGDQGTSTKGKGKAFFDRADQVAETGNWDFAIEMYIEGIKREPDNIERGHKPLREVSLKRKLQGGKPAGMMDAFKHGSSKDPKENLANAEYLLAKDPGNIQRMVGVLQAAAKMDQMDVLAWVCDMLMEAMRQAKKPNMKILRLLIDAYSQTERYGKASQACAMALKLAPNDEWLQSKQKELSANYTIQQGKYDQEGDVSKSVRDMEKQKDLAQKDALVKTKSYLEKQIAQAREEYLQAPDVAAKVLNYAEALARSEDESFENEAIDVLRKAYDETGNYQFKLRTDDIRMRQMTREYRQAVQKGNKGKATQLARRQLEFELDVYKERAANYPTDLGLKYELGRRQFLAGNIDEAIGSLQQAQRDPRRELLALNYLGMAFARKDWYQEAADTFRRALEREVPEERAKELRYNLGDALEHMDKLQEAQEQFSAVAQTDFNFKDVRQRLDRVRKELEKEQEG